MNSGPVKRQVRDFSPSLDLKGDALIVEGNDPAVGEGGSTVLQIPSEVTYCGAGFYKELPTPSLQIPLVRGCGESEVDTTSSITPAPQQIAISSLIVGPRKIVTPADLAGSYKLATALGMRIKPLRVLQISSVTEGICKLIVRRIASGKQGYTPRKFLNPKGCPPRISINFFTYQQSRSQNLGYPPRKFLSEASINALYQRDL